jgi:hypothetical protein
MSYVALFFATFAQVGFKATQQLNVVKGAYFSVVPISFAMAASEVYIIASIASTDGLLPSVGVMGLGGGAGCILAMYLHNRIFTARG